MRKLITHKKYSKRNVMMSCLFLMTALIMGSSLGIVVTTSNAMGEVMKKFEKNSGDSDRRATLDQQNLNFAIPNSDAKDTHVDVEETIVINGDHCGVEDEGSGSSYPIDCDTGEPL
jgi:hypothetical protein